VTRYLARRLASFALLLAAALTLLFLALHALSSGSTYGLAPTVAANPEARAAAAGEQGLDRPLLEQYVDHMGGMLRGDLGRSFADGSPVSDAVASALPISFGLGLLATAIGVVPGVVLGVVAALRPRSIVDGVVRVTSLLAVSVPSYWLAVISLVVIGDRWPELVPRSGGVVRFSDDPVANLQALLLPAAVLGLGALGMVARTTRTAVAEVLSGDDVQFARAMGMTRRQVMTRVALRNAAPTGATVAGLVVAGLLSGTVLVENVFQLPGLGQLMVNAFGRQDLPLAMGAAAVTAVVHLGLNLAVDVGLAAVDPRMRQDRSGPATSTGAVAT
jgi:peptide/nickel transport system permease protein